MLLARNLAITLGKVSNGCMHRLKAQSIQFERRERRWMVYVLNMDGRPLMPTERHGKVRRMLRDGKAKVIRRCPYPAKN